MSSYQTRIQSRFQTRDIQESCFQSMILHSERLTNYALQLLERNRSLLISSSSSSIGNGIDVVPTGSYEGKGKQPSGVGVGVVATPVAAVATSINKVNPNSSSSSDADRGLENRQEIEKLSKEINSLKFELTEQYKVQSTNAQRLLNLTDQLRKVEEKGREEREELIGLRTQVARLNEKAKWHKEVVLEKERQLIILQDDQTALELELNQILQQNEHLKIDNASLLQRWIEAKNEEARRMNELFDHESIKVANAGQIIKEDSSTGTKASIGSDEARVGVEGKGKGKALDETNLESQTT